MTLVYAAEALQVVLKAIRAGDLSQRDLAPLAKMMASEILTREIQARRDPPKPQACECIGWAQDCKRYLLWPTVNDAPLGHHPNCTHYAFPTLKRLKELYEAGVTFDFRNKGIAMDRDMALAVFQERGMACDLYIKLHNIEDPPKPK
jgi:hypothetical protein